MKGKTEDVHVGTQVPPVPWPCEATLTPRSTCLAMNSFNSYICFWYLEVQHQTWCPAVVSQALDRGEDFLAQAAGCTLANTAPYHRNTEQLGLAGTSGDHAVQPTC